MKTLNFTLSIFILILVFACSSSQESQNGSSNEEYDKNDIYVFDDVGEEKIDTLISVESEVVDSTVLTNQEIDTDDEINENPLVNPVKFIVQLGAFSTRDRAETFVRQNLSKIEWNMNVSFSDKVGFFVLQLPPFNTREEAEKVRNLLWQTQTFRDAFIVPNE